MITDWKNASLDEISKELSRLLHTPAVDVSAGELGEITVALRSLKKHIMSLDNYLNLVEYPFQMEAAARFSMRPRYYIDQNENITMHSLDSANGPFHNQEFAEKHAQRLEDNNRAHIGRRGVSQKTYTVYTYDPKDGKVKKVDRLDGKK